MLSKSALKDGNWDEATCTLNNGVLLYNLTAWRSSGLENGVSYTDQLFSWSIKNSEDKLYNLGSQPPFNLVVRLDSHLTDTVLTSCSHVSVLVRSSDQNPVARTAAHAARPLVATSRFSRTAGTYVSYFRGR